MQELLPKSSEILNIAHKQIIVSTSVVRCIIIVYHLENSVTSCKVVTTSKSKLEGFVRWSFRLFVMTDISKQRVCIKLVCKLHKNMIDSFQMLHQAFGDQVLGGDHSNVYTV